MKSDRLEIAHLMRRAGFGTTPAELDTITEEKINLASVVSKQNTEMYNTKGSLQQWVGLTSLLER